MYLTNFYVSCLRTQHTGASETRTSNPSVSVIHFTTEPLCSQLIINNIHTKEATEHAQVPRQGTTFLLLHDILIGFLSRTETGIRIFELEPKTSEEPARQTYYSFMDPLAALDPYSN